MSNVSNRMTSEQYRELIGKQARTGKYRNTKVTWNGKWRGENVTIKFDSIKEMYDGIQAMDREKRGLIEKLEFQKRFELIPKSSTEPKLSFVLDRFYYDPTPTSWVVSDTKGFKTRVYINKRKLFKDRYPDILFLET